MHCRALPLRSLPHQPRLLLHFLYEHDRVARFYRYKPNLESAIASAKALSYPAERRAAVAAILREQNAAFGCGAQTVENLKRFENGAAVVVTGQQVGLFTGPAYAVYKALSAARVAREDHDLDEVRHTTFFHDGTLTRFELPSGPRAGAPVGKIPLGEMVNDVV